MSITRIHHDEGGFALPVAMLAMVVVGVMVTGGFFMARQETRIGVASQNAHAALYVAEAGINQTLASWSTANFNLGAWNDTTVSGATSEGEWSVTVTPMTSRLFYLDATGTTTAGGSMWSGATHRVGMIARVQMAELFPPAALTTVGELSLGGSAIVDGRDQDPAAWSGLCPDPKKNKPAILIDDTTNINYNGNKEEIVSQQIFGEPKVAQDAAMSPDELLIYGEMDFDDLTAMADIVLSSSVIPAPTLTASGLCNTSVNTNWGAPLSPTSDCFDYLPIIWLKGENTNFHIAEGIGQGVLLVEGDLQVTGQFEFYGPVIVKGSLITTGGGGKHFYGGVIAANVSLDDQKVLGTADIIYSSCAVTRSLMGNPALNEVRPLRSRSWVDLSSIDPSLEIDPRR